MRLRLASFNADKEALLDIGAPVHGL